MFKPAIAITITLILFRAGLSYAQDKSDIMAAELDTASAQGANIEAGKTPQGNNNLREDNVFLRGQLNAANRDREQLLEKFRIVNDENIRLKNRLEELGSRVVTLEEERQKKDKDAAQMADEFAKMKKEFKYDAEMKKRAQSYFRKSQELRSEIQELEKEKTDYLEQAKQEKMKLEVDIVQLKMMTASLKKKNDEYFNDRGRLEYKLQEVLGAKKPAAKIKRDLGDKHYNLGVDFQRDGRWDEAITEYKEALGINPNDADAHFNLAFIYDTVKNNRNGAFLHYQKYLQIRPDAPDAARVKWLIAGLSTKNIGQGERLERWP